MERHNVHLRHAMLFFFKKGCNAIQAKTEICAVYGDSAVSLVTVRKWFKRFKSGDFDLEDRERSGAPVRTHTDRIKAYVEENPRSAVRDVAEALEIPPTTVFRHLKKIGFVNRYDVWVPHDLTDQHKQNRMSICDSLLVRNSNDPFLKRLVTGDETWICYENMTRKRSWSMPGSRPQTVAKPGLHPKKVLLSVWWDWKGVLHYELLQPNQTINSAKYCSQLDDLKAAIAEKRPELHNRRGVVFHHDNARPHTSSATRDKLLQFGWDVLPHPAYSPDLAPSDYHLFLSLKNSLAGKNSIP